MDSFVSLCCIIIFPAYFSRVIQRSLYCTSKPKDTGLSSRLAQFGRGWGGRKKELCHRRTGGRRRDRFCLLSVPIAKQVQQAGKRKKWQAEISSKDALFVPPHRERARTGKILRLFKTEEKEILFSRASSPRHEKHLGFLSLCGRSSTRRTHSQV